MKSYSLTQNTKFIRINRYLTKLQHPFILSMCLNCYRATNRCGWSNRNGRCSTENPPKTVHNSFLFRFSVGDDFSLSVFLLSDIVEICKRCDRLVWSWCLPPRDALNTFIKIGETQCTLATGSSKSALFALISWCRCCRRCCGRCMFRSLL